MSKHNLLKHTCLLSVHYYRFAYYSTYYRIIIKHSWLLSGCHRLLSVTALVTPFVDCVYCDIKAIQQIVIGMLIVWMSHVLQTCRVVYGTLYDSCCVLMCTGVNVVWRICWFKHTLLNRVKVQTLFTVYTRNYTNTDLSIFLCCF